MAMPLRERAAAAEPATAPLASPRALPVADRVEPRPASPRSASLPPASLLPASLPPVSWPLVSERLVFWPPAVGL